MGGDIELGALQKLLDEGWGYHDTQSNRLAFELEAAVAQEDVPPGLLIGFLQLSNHTLGEHLADWPRALALGKRTLAGRAPLAETGRAWGRLYVAATLACDAIEAAKAELSYLKAAGETFGAAFLEMRFLLAAALIGAKRACEGAKIYRAALDLAGHAPPSAFLDRTIATASNNLGWELYEQPERTSEEDALMKLAAETSLTFWLKCGNWINAELGHYLKAVAANAMGEAAVGLKEADRGLAVIAANGERPLDEARLHLARAVSLEALSDPGGSIQAIAAADAAAAKIPTEHLKALFADERGKIVAGLSC